VKDGARQFTPLEQKRKLAGFSGRECYTIKEPFLTGVILQQKNSNFFLAKGHSRYFELVRVPHVLKLH